MAYSMTGYGRGEKEAFGMAFSVEVKSVNHRYCDISIRMPRNMVYLENRLKQLVAKYVSRGKVDIFVSYDEFAVSSTEIRIDEDMADAYFQAFKLLKQKFGFKDDISISGFSQIPGIMKVEKKEAGEEEVWDVLSGAATPAFEALKSMRQKEGAKLVEDIRDRLSVMGTILSLIEERAPLVAVEYRVRLSTRIKELVEQNDVIMDETRLATEVAIFADKASVDEEIVRLKSHISQAGKCLELTEPIGRKLDFIVQEMNREINTIGSKANDLIINGQVVDLKSEIEKIREQIQNIE